MSRSPSTPGPRPYGQTAKELAVIAVIVTGHDAGRTWRELADRLNEHGSRQRNGKPWTPAAVKSKHPRVRFERAERARKGAAR